MSRWTRAPQRALPAANYTPRDILDGFGVGSVRVPKSRVSTRKSADL